LRAQREEALAAYVPQQSGVLSISSFQVKVVRLQEYYRQL
jgi:hypothetical protein